MAHILCIESPSTKLAFKYLLDDLSIKFLLLNSFLVAGLNPTHEYNNYLRKINRFLRTRHFDKIYTNFLISDANYYYCYDKCYSLNPISELDNKKAQIEKNLIANVKFKYILTSSRTIYKDFTKIFSKEKIKIIEPIVPIISYTKPSRHKLKALIMTNKRDFDVINNHDFQIIYTSPYHKIQTLIKMQDIQVLIEDNFTYLSYVKFALLNKIFVISTHNSPGALYVKHLTNGILIKNFNTKSINLALKKIKKMLNNKEHDFNIKKIYNKIEFKDSLI